MKPWPVKQGEVRVTCSMTVGGSFDVKTTAISGSVAPASGGSQALDGNLVVDLRTLDTGVGLRNRHLRESYVEVDKAPGFRDCDVIGDSPRWAGREHAGDKAPHKVNEREA